jgi:hypothetical protein
MAEPLTLEYRILPNNGSGWYWEVVTQEREVIARGLAMTHNQARIDAVSAGLDQRPQNPLNGSSHWPASPKLSQTS